ncbi:unnamed protein product [Brassica rapa subsp. narinosa]
MHLNHQPDTRRIRLDSTAAVSKHHRNHLTTTYFRRSSETVEPPPNPSQFFETPSTRRRASSHFESISDQAPTRSNNEPQTKITTTKNLKPATRS